ncbi:uncharacterized protein [Magallana gigas]|uniref:uncharacterized protein n=1 Tax=Magallana gigas TaxID=29159 RepID=UPI003340AEB6
MLVKMQWSLRSTCLLWYILVPMVGTVLPIYQRDNVWRQDRPSSDNLFSLSSGNVWQDQPSLDPLRPFHTGNVWRQEPFSDSYFGGAWQQWSSLDSPSHDQPSYSSQLMFSTPFGNKRYREKIQEMVSEGYPQAPDCVKETIATDTFLKGLENKRAALTTMDKDPPDLETALQLVKAALNNQRLILGARGEEGSF